MARPSRLARASAEMIRYCECRSFPRRLSLILTATGVVFSRLHYRVDEPVPGGEHRLTAVRWTPVSQDERGRLADPGFQQAILPDDGRGDAIARRRVSAAPLPRPSRGRRN